MKFRRLAAVVFVFSLAAHLSADVVETKGGDKITGTVIAREGDVLVVETSYMGEVAIAFDEISRITTETPLTIQASGGNRLVGPANYDASTGMTVRSQTGVVTVALADIEAIGPHPLPAPEPSKWEGSLEIGVLGQSGNKETLIANGRLAAEREFDDMTISGYASGRYARENGVRSANRQRLGGKIEQLLDTDYFAYGALDLLRDEFKDLDLRASATAGLGKTWWEEDTNMWKTGAGIGFTSETYRSGGNDTFPNAELTSEYGKQLGPATYFADVTRIVFDLTSIEGFTAENDASLKFQLDSNGRWAMKVGLNHQYDGDPEPGIDGLDTYYYLSAVRGF